MTLIFPLEYAPPSTSLHRARLPALAGLPSSMKTQGEIEAAICQGMSKFEQEYMGRGPTHVRAHLFGDLLKEVRSQLIEIARPVLEAMVLDVTGVKTLSMHHDISTVRGEEVVLFSLEKSPPFREMKRS